MSEHRHSYSGRFEGGSSTCTVKLFECPCGDWRLRHYGCHGNWDSGDLERQLAEAQGKIEALVKAGVTDYSKLTGTNRVDCHFCNGVWRTEELPKHRSTCPLGRILLKEGNNV